MIHEDDKYLVIRTAEGQLLVFGKLNGQILPVSPETAPQWAELATTLAQLVAHVTAPAPQQ